MEDEVRNESEEPSGETADGTASGGSTGAEQDLTDELFKELTVLGGRVGFKKVRENEQAQDVLEKADDVADSVGEKVRSSEAVNELGNSLIRGLHSLAGQLEKWTAEMAAHDVPPAAGDPGAESNDEAQDIPIDQA